MRNKLLKREMALIGKAVHGGYPQMSESWVDGTIKYHLKVYLVAHQKIRNGRRWAEIIPYKVLIKLKEKYHDYGAIYNLDEMTELTIIIDIMSKHHSKNTHGFS